MTPSEFDRQLDTYVAAGFGAVPGFASSAGAARDAFESAEAGDLPATLVVRASLVGEQLLVSGIDRQDGKPQTVIHAAEMAEYNERDGVEVPDADVYVLSGISKEVGTRNVAPSGALEQILTAGRSPLTIEEGLAIWRMHPEAIAENDGLSLAGSTRGDKRVPAIWISRKRPKLGWCFYGVPHTWLATASCSARLSA